jgi:hypothetical protein
LFRSLLHAGSRAFGCWAGKCRDNRRFLQTVAAAPPSERPSFGAADERVIENLLKRLRGVE